MKFLIIFAFCVAAASAGVIAPITVADEVAEIQQILDAINHPSTDPATAAALEEMLYDLLGIKPAPIVVGPAIVEGEYEPISVGPAIVEGEYEQISVGPAFVDEVIPAPVAPAPESSPLVQIIINVKPGVAGNPVSVEEVDTRPVIVAPSPQPDLIPVIVLPSPQPEPVVVGQPEVEPTPVIVVDQPEVAEPVIVSPVIIPEPVMVLPDILN